MATNFISYRTCSLGADVSQDLMDGGRWRSLVEFGYPGTCIWGQFGNLSVASSLAVKPASCEYDRSQHGDDDRPGGGRMHCISPRGKCTVQSVASNYDLTRYVSTQKDSFDGGGGGGGGGVLIGADQHDD